MKSLANNGKVIFIYIRKATFEKIRMINTTLKKIRPKTVFYIICLINIIAITIALLTSKGQFLSEIIWDAKHQIFSDFLYPIGLVRNPNPYNINNLDGEYPALAYFIFYIIDIIIPAEIINSTVDTWYLLFYSVSLCLCTFIITWIIGRMVKNTYDSFAICIVFFLSLPFAYATIKSGNIIIYTLVLVTLSMYLRNSKSTAMRELSLILLAIAAGIKITPAVLGVLWLKEKRWKEVLHLVIYGIFFFFVPFLFFSKDAFPMFLEIITSVSAKPIPRPESIPGVFIELGDVTGLGLNIGYTIGQLVSFIFLVVVLFIFFTCETDWKSLLLLVSLMVVFVNGSYPYTMQYYLIPMIYLVLDDTVSYKVFDYIEASLFALAMNSFPFIKIIWPTATFITNYFFLYILIIVVILEKLIIKAGTINKH